MMKRCRMLKRHDEEERIPDELLMDGILKRLPVRSLQRFLWVSKSWYSTISSPWFMAVYRQHQHQHQHQHGRANSGILFLYSNHLAIRYYNDDGRFLGCYQTPYGRQEHSIFPTLCRKLQTHRACWGYSEGLLCLLIPKVPDIDDDGRVPYYYKEEIFLFNPILRKSLLLPTDSYDYFSHLRDAHLLSILHCRYSVFGFGYDESSCDYKVVRATLVIPQMKTRLIKGRSASASASASTAFLRANVYSLKSKSWRTFDVTDLPCSVGQVRGLLSTYNGVNFNGGIYWTLGKCLLAFRLADEVFDFHPLTHQELTSDPLIRLIPVKLMHNEDHGNAGNKTFEFKLGVVTLIKAENLFSLWVMMDDQSSPKGYNWVNLLRFDKERRFDDYLDIARVVDFEFILVKDKHGQWIMSDVMSEELSNYTTLINGGCGHDHGERIHRLLVTSFQESLVGLI